jgi:uncharacterized membrane protein
MDHVVDRQGVAHVAPQVRLINTARPLVWLSRGWADMVLAWRASLGHGVLVAGFGLLLLVAAAQATYLVPTLIGGFLLVAPFVAIVHYGLSRQIEAGVTPDSTAAWAAVRHNPGSIGLYGLMLALALIAWERVAAVVFALFMGSEVPDLTNLAADVLFSGRHLGLLAAFLVAGAVMAAVVFALSVVTVPLLLERDVDLITAAITSVQCCVRNPLPMLIWAVLIGCLTAWGFAMLMLGLVVIFPLLGHASWHAYRDLVE